MSKMQVDCKVTFGVAGATITPALATCAGRQGENNATLVNFQISGLNIPVGTVTKYRVDAIDGAGGIHNGAVMELDNTSAYTELSVPYNVPRDVTEAGGRAEVFVVITTFTEGEENYSLETPALTLMFANMRSVGAFGEEETKRGINAAIKQAEDLLEETKVAKEEAEARAEAAGDSAESAGASAEAAAENVALAETHQTAAEASAVRAEERAVYAGQRAEDARAYSEFAQQQCFEALQHSKAAAENATLAEAHKTAAENAAESATISAESAENSALSAVASAEAAVASAEAAAESASKIELAADKIETNSSRIDEIFNSVAVKEEMYRFTNVINFLAGTDTYNIYHIDSNFVDLSVDLKKGETYVISIITPYAGESVSFGSLGVLYYEGDRYTGEVIADKNYTKLNYVEVRVDADYEIYSTAEIVIECKVLPESIMKIESKLLSGTAEDWEETNVADFPYLAGKAIKFNGELIKGVPYKCSVEIQSEKLDYLIRFGFELFKGEERLISEDFEYNAENGVFEAEFISNVSTEASVELLLAVGYPLLSSYDQDYNAVYGKVEITYTNDLRDMVEVQSKKIGDIETALDGIIAIQENLIGGETS